MRSQRVVESEWRSWNPAAWLLVTLLGSLILAAVSVLLRHGDVKINKRAISDNNTQTSVMTLQVRLVNGRNRCEGRVEVFHNVWGTVCDDDWDMVDASVVCRQLECGMAVEMGRSLRFGQGVGFIALDNVNCRGNESNLGHCYSLGWGVHNCYHYEDVGVTCREMSLVVPKGFGGPTVAPGNTHDLRDGTVQLVNGHHACQGRVEIFFRGFWGTVCDDDWGMENARVVCRQLGCGEEVFAHTNSYFGYGTGHIHLDNVHCTGNEPGLSMCRFLDWGQHNCGHHEDAGVTCMEVVSEVSTVIRGIEQTIPTTPNTEAPQPATNNYTDAPSTTTTVTATTTTTTIARPQVRLSSGLDSCQGRVEVLYNNVWGTVCDDGWTMESGHVVCRQIGCGPAIAVKGQAFFGYGNGPILLDNVVCQGQEELLTDCKHLGWGVHNCGHHEDTGVICAGIEFAASFLRGLGATEPPTPISISTALALDGEVRLVGGLNSCEGRVEIYLDSSWGTVCDDAWDLPDAEVVCHQVGCGRAIAAVDRSHFGIGTGRILLDNLKCTGTEASLLDCSHIGWDVHNCDHSEDAGVACSMS